MAHIDRDQIEVRELIVGYLEDEIRFARLVVEAVAKEMKLPVDEVRWACARSLLWTGRRVALLQARGARARGARARARPPAPALARRPAADALPTPGGLTSTHVPPLPLTPSPVRH